MAAMGQAEIDQRVRKAGEQVTAGAGDSEGAIETSPGELDLYRAVPQGEAAPVTALLSSAVCKVATFETERENAQAAADRADKFGNAEEAAFYRAIFERLVRIAAQQVIRGVSASSGLGVDISTDIDLAACSSETAARAFAVAKKLGDEALAKVLSNLAAIKIRENGGSRRRSIHLYETYILFIADSSDDTQRERYLSHIQGRINTALTNMVANWNEAEQNEVIKDYLMKPEDPLGWQFLDYAVRFGDINLLDKAFSVLGEFLTDRLTVEHWNALDTNGLPLLTRAAEKKCLSLVLMYVLTTIPVANRQAAQKVIETVLAEVHEQAGITLSILQTQRGKLTHDSKILSGVIKTLKSKELKLPTQSAQVKVANVIKNQKESIDIERQKFNALKKQAEKYPGLADNAVFKKLPSIPSDVAVVSLNPEWTASDVVSETTRLEEIVTRIQGALAAGIRLPANAGAGGPATVLDEVKLRELINLHLAGNLQEQAGIAEEIDVMREKYDQQVTMYEGLLDLSAQVDQHRAQQSTLANLQAHLATVQARCSEAETVLTAAQQHVENLRRVAPMLVKKIEGIQADTAGLKGIVTSQGATNQALLDSIAQLEKWHGVLILRQHIDALRAELGQEPLKTRHYDNTALLTAADMADIAVPAAMHVKGIVENVCAAFHVELDQYAMSAETESALNQAVTQYNQQRGELKRLSSARKTWQQDYTGMLAAIQEFAAYHDNSAPGDDVAALEQQLAELQRQAAVRQKMTTLETRIAGLEKALTASRAAAVSSAQALEDTAAEKDQKIAELAKELGDSRVTAESALKTVRDEHAVQVADLERQLKAAQAALAVTKHKAESAENALTTVRDEYAAQTADLKKKLANVQNTLAAARRRNARFQLLQQLYCKELLPKRALTGWESFRYQQIMKQFDILLGLVEALEIEIGGPVLIDIIGLAASSFIWKTPSNDLDIQLSASGMTPEDLKAAFTNILSKRGITSLTARGFGAGRRPQALVKVAGQALDISFVEPDMAREPKPDCFMPHMAGKLVIYDGLSRDYCYVPPPCTADDEASSFHVNKMVTDIIREAKEASPYDPAKAQNIMVRNLTYCLRSILAASGWWRLIGELPGDGAMAYSYGALPLHETAWQFLEDVFSASYGKDVFDQVVTQVCKKAGVKHDLFFSEANALSLDFVAQGKTAASAGAEALCKRLGDSRPCEGPVYTIDQLREGLISVPSADVNAGAGGYGMQGRAATLFAPVCHKEMVGRYEPLQHAG